MASLWVRRAAYEAAQIVEAGLAAAVAKPAAPSKSKKKKKKR